MFLQTPELQISGNEADQLARSYIALATHYGWTAGAGGPAMMWLTFGSALAAIEGRRIIIINAVIKQRIARARAGKPARDPAAAPIDPGGAYPPAPPPRGVPAGGVDLSGLAS